VPEVTNADVAHRAVAAVMAEPPDLETLSAVLDPSHALTTDWGTDKREHLGLRGYLDARAEMVAAWDPWQQEVDCVIDAGESGVVLLLTLRARGRGSGVSVEVPWAMVMTLRGGRVTASRVFLDQDEALRAAGREE
jgi:ketosteroid isomerase-like protein